MTTFLHSLLAIWNALLHMLAEATIPALMFAVFMVLVLAVANARTKRGMR